MKWLARYLFKVAIASCLVCIIGAWWQMAEVKMYGYSQESIIDTMAAAAIALAAAELLVGGK